MSGRAPTDADGRGREVRGLAEPRRIEGEPGRLADGRDPVRGLEDAAEEGGGERPASADERVESLVEVEPRDRSTYLSLFSGIGGLDLAVERLGFEPVGQVEYDAACVRVLERWWPDVPRWGDVRTFGAASYAESVGRERPRRDGGLEGTSSAGEGEGSERERVRPHGRPRVDLVVGGFPCQPASHAGSRKGTADDRWLWPEVARLVGEFRPGLVLVENVPGLLTVNGGRAFSEILGDLASLRYDATWTSLRASDVGACHRRERVFLLAESSEGGRPPDADGLGRERDRGMGRGLAGSPDDGRFPWGKFAAAIERAALAFGRPPPLPVDDRGRLAVPFVEWMMGFPEGWVSGISRSAALKTLGNAVVPAQGEEAVRRLARVLEAEAA